jgi:hypothetical protein
MSLLVPELLTISLSLAARRQQAVAGLDCSTGSHWNLATMSIFGVFVLIVAFY